MRRPVLAVAVATIGVFALGGTLVALALASATSPPAPIGDACLSVSVTPHTVSAGGVVTARTGPGTGGCPQPRLEWNWFVNGEEDASCGTSSTTCAIEASRPTNGYRPICAIGTGASAGIQACDYVAVVASGRFTLSGQITARSPLVRRLAEKTPKLANVAGATVEAVDSDGKTFTTKTVADGSYSLGVPAGRYTVRVDPDAGIGYHGATTPESRIVVVKGDVGHVNFRLGRIIHLQVEATYSGFASEHGSLMRFHFTQHGRPVGFARAVCDLTCTAHAVLKGIPGHPWLQVKWRSVNARGGEGVITTDKVETDEDGTPNYPTEENLYEGTITVHAEPLAFVSSPQHPAPVTIELI